MRGRAAALAACALVGSGCAGALAPSSWHTSPDRWSGPRVHHTAFDSAFEGRMSLSRSVAVQDGLERVFSPNGAYWYAASIPDFRRSPPWSTALYVFTEREYLLRLDIKDHGNTLPRIQWVNEKLLYVDVWWGRILGTYLIVDVEQGRIVTREMMHDGVIPFQQFR